MFIQGNSIGVKRDIHRLPSLLSLSHYLDSTGTEDTENNKVNKHSLKICGYIDESNKKTPTMKIE